MPSESLVLVTGNAHGFRCPLWQSRCEGQARQHQPGIYRLSENIAWHGQSKVWQYKEGNQCQTVPRLKSIAKFLSFHSRESQHAHWPQRDTHSRLRPSAKVPLLWIACSPPDSGAAFPSWPQGEALESRTWGTDSVFCTMVQALLFVLFCGSSIRARTIREPTVGYIVMPCHLKPL
jgi:hypothetical protein